MDHHRTSNDEWADQHRQALTSRHSPEDVLNDREFELLLEARGELPAPWDFEARISCLPGGRLGLRAGGIAHSRLAGWTGTASSSASQHTNRVRVGTVSASPVKNLLAR